MSASRRQIVLGLSAGWLAASGAQAESPGLDARKGFPFLEAYLSLRADQRDAFHPAYVLHAKQGSLNGAQVWLLAGGRRTALRFNGAGRFIDTPTLGQLRSGAKIVLNFPPGLKAGVRLSLEATAPLVTQYSPRLLDRALRQATAGGRAAGGFAALTAPRLDRVVFVGSRAGETIRAGGATSPLPLIQAEPTAVLKDVTDAQLIRLRKAPLALRLEAAS